jgi:flagellar assembly protein FliH
MRITRLDFGQLHNFRSPSETVLMADDPQEPSALQIEEPQEILYRQAELDAAVLAAKQTGHQEGFEAGRTSIDQELIAREQEARAAMESLVENLPMIASGYDSVIASQSASLHQFVMAIARKLVGEALNQFPDHAISDLIAQCLPILVQKPRLTVEANTPLVNLLTDRLKPMLEQAGFEGEIQFRANDVLAASDTRIEWSGGYAERNTESLWNEIEAIMANITFYSPLATIGAPDHG